MSRQLIVKKRPLKMIMIMIMTKLVTICEFLYYTYIGVLYLLLVELSIVSTWKALFVVTASFEPDLFAT